MDEVLAAPLAVSHIVSRMLIQISPIVLCKPVSIQCKMYRHIIHDRTYAILMQSIDQKFQVICGPISRRWTEETRILIAP